MTPRHLYRGETSLGIRRLTVVVVIAGLMAIGIAVQAAGGLLRDAGVVASPTQYLALAMNNPTSLPDQVAPGEAVHFSFTISSTRRKAVDQEWIVALASSGTKKLVVSEGRAKVGPDTTVVIPVSFSMPQVSGDLTVSVSAPGGGMAPLQFHVTTAAESSAA
jgi:hypothetical protein